MKEDEAVKLMPEKIISKEKKPGKRGWILWGTAICFLLAVVTSCMYNLFQQSAAQDVTSFYENRNTISRLYCNTYLLYADLYNMQSTEQKDYISLYLEPQKGYEWILEINTNAGSPTLPDESMRYITGAEDLLKEDLYAETGESSEEALYGEDGESGEEALYGEDGVSAEQKPYSEGGEGTPNSEGTVTEQIYLKLWESMSQINAKFLSMEESFSMLNKHYGYIIHDDNTGLYSTNMSQEEINSDQYFLLAFQFNEYGGVTVKDSVVGVEGNQLRKTANEVIRTNPLVDAVTNSYREKIFQEYVTIKGPVSCTVTYCVPKASSGSLTAYYDPYYSYWMNDLSNVLLLFFFLAMGCGFLLPVLKGARPWAEVRICRYKFEALFLFGCIVCGVFISLYVEAAFAVASGQASDTLYPLLGGDNDMADILIVSGNLLCLTGFYICGWYLGICLRAVRELGLKEYIKQKSLIYGIFPFIKKKCFTFYDSIRHFDVTKNAHKTILKIVLINAMILFIISSLWFGGFAITMIYSVLLYVALRKYISDLQKKYGILLQATNEISQGNLNVSITEDLGVFEPFKPQVIRIQNGFKNAVENEVKSQRMKAELITNVSHDLKTPLTAIITYINLLKEENITEEQRREYLDTLERKALRLKVLIEDLFEVSKATSQNVTLNLMNVDIMNLIKQVVFEMSDKLSEANLDVRMNLTDEKVLLRLDSQKTYRIYENLLGNVAKYALAGTRVYINGFRIDDTVVITMKNISAQELTVDTEELTERFVRGDASRNTEGSGLGLAIAKSFAELQGGKLTLEVDGDLFKAVTTWHIGQSNLGNIV